MQLEKIVTLNDINYKVVFPTVGQSTEADIDYSKSYNSSLKNGILPRVAMEAYVRNNELWEVEKDNEIDLLNKELGDITFEIKKEKDLEKRKVLTIKFIEKRDELLVLGSERESLYHHTAESKGEEARISSLIWKCVSKEDGTKVWASKEDFLNERDSQLVSGLVQAFVGFTSGLEKKMEQLNDIFKDPISEDNKEESVGALIGEDPTESSAAEEKPKEEVSV